MKKLMYFILTFICLNVLGQSGTGGSDGGPGMVLNYVDSNGQIKRFVVEDGMNVPPELMEQYFKELGRRYLRPNPMRKHFVNIGGAIDITTKDGNNYDLQSLQEINPTWLKEEDGDIYVDPQAPIIDYQKEDGTIVKIKLPHPFKDD